MALWDKVRGEFVDVIEWTDDTNDTMVYRFPRYGNEIKYGGSLVVREGQAAVFINEGALADVFEPGTYALETQNLPILTTLQNWPRGFESPFKAEVYYVSTRQFTDLKWGTKNPIMMRDQEFGPVRLRSFGTYALRITDPATFIREITGTDGEFTSDEITGQLRNIVVSRYTDALAESGIPVLDMAANQDELGEVLRERIAGEFDEYGLELTKLLVENISLPDAVEEALDKRTSMGVVGDLRAYTQYQAAEAIEDAAQNPGAGGLAAGGMAAGLGLGFAGHMAEAAMPRGPGGGQGAGGQGGTAAPPPIPEAPKVYAALDGKQAGPFSPAELKEKIAAGAVTRETLVWKEGMSEWSPAESVPDVASLFGAAPPPLPED